MPRLERTVLLGYDLDSRRGKGLVRRPGEVQVEVEVTELVFTDPVSGDQVIYPMDEETRVKLIGRLTGGVRVVT